MEVLLQNVFALLLYFVPGFIAREFYLARYPARKASEASVLIWSAIYTFAIHFCLALLASATSQPRLNFLGRPLNSSVDATSVGILLAAGLVAGLILIGVHWAREKIPFLPTPRPERIWPIVARQLPDEELWAVVRVTSAVIYLGWIREFTFDPDAKDQDFYLSPALVVDDRLNTIRDLGPAVCI